ncbi:hypothetical protein BD289DRAFT_371647 [Coniella lustricola]|uniref:BZIP domain-containing protein n=1 Tax=Coniella lustricola TaxID=2025994 RepID=A0A2T3A3F6_9PEZI|nr:hypothetical protein BD289DRAFT_371647 [Coniella lustricola]
MAYGGGAGVNLPLNQRSTPMASANSHDDPDNVTPTSLSLGFLKSLSDKKLTRDGQPAKRRGPKPDSKPALTRRQELNRQAQRTHRERKELYIKALEEEVLRLKEIFSNVNQDKDRLAEENQSLRVLLHQNGLNHSSTASTSGGGGGSRGARNSRTSYGGFPSSMSHTTTTAYTGGSPPPPGSALSINSAVPAVLSPGVTALSLSPAASTQTAGLTTTTGSSTSGASPLPAHPTMLVDSGPRRNPRIDYEQAGIDFVLTLERPCMDHLPWLLERSHASGGLEPCGHALMASCPPEPFSLLSRDVPFGRNQGHTQHPHNSSHSNGGGPVVAATNQVNGGTSTGSGTGTTVVINGGANATALPTTWELTKAGLATLLDLSLKFNLDGEITPVMAWGMVLAHPRLGEMVEGDFGRLAEELTGKVRCYGFGAVMEEFEVRDALEAVYSDKA